MKVLSFYIISIAWRVVFCEGRLLQAQISEQTCALCCQSLGNQGFFILNQKVERCQEEGCELDGCQAVQFACRQGERFRTGLPTEPQVDSFGELVSYSCQANGVALKITPAPTPAQNPSGGIIPGVENTDSPTTLVAENLILGNKAITIGAGAAGSMLVLVLLSLLAFRYRKRSMTEKPAEKAVVETTDEQRGSGRQFWGTRSGRKRWLENFTPTISLPRQLSSGHWKEKLFSWRRENVNSMVVSPSMVGAPPPAPPPKTVKARKSVYNPADPFPDPSYVPSPDVLEEEDPRALSEEDPRALSVIVADTRTRDQKELEKRDQRPISRFVEEEL